MQMEILQLAEAYRIGHNLPIRRSLGLFILPSIIPAFRVLPTIFRTVVHLVSRLSLCVFVHPFLYVRACSHLLDV